MRAKKQLQQRRREWAHHCVAVKGGVSIWAILSPMDIELIADLVVEKLKEVKSET